MIFDINKQIQIIRRIMSQKKDKAQIYRINKQFIGLGQELEEKKRSRKELDLQEMLMQNRVTYFEKEKSRARKSLIDNKKKYRQLMDIQQRHENDLRQKARLMQQRMDQEERQRRINQERRMMNQTRKMQAQQHLKMKNRSDYMRIKNQSFEGQKKLTKIKRLSIDDKKGKWLAINTERQRGKNKVQTFYKTKNQGFISDYKNKISIEIDKSQSKIYSINELEEEKVKAYHELKKTAKQVNNIADRINYLAMSRAKPLDSMYNISLREEKKTTHNTTQNGTPEEDEIKNSIRYEQEDEDLCMSQITEKQYEKQEIQKRQQFSRNQEIRESQKQAQLSKKSSKEDKKSDKKEVEIEMEKYEQEREEVKKQKTKRSEEQQDREEE